MRHNVRGPNLVIAAAGTNSTEIPASRLSHLRGLGIQAPSTLTGVCTVQVSMDENTFAELLSGGSPVTIGAGQAIIIDAAGYLGLRIQSGAAEAAERTFLTVAIEER